MKLKRTISIVLTTVLCLIMVACTAAEVFQIMNTVAGLASALVPIILSAVPNQNMSAETKAKVEAYTQAVNNGVICSGPIASSTDTDALKGAKIAVCFSGAVAPVLPTGTPQNIVTAVNQLSAEVAKFLAAYQPPGSVVAKSAKASVHTPSSADKKLIDQAVATAQASNAALARARP